MATSPSTVRSFLGYRCGDYASSGSRSQSVERGAESLPATNHVVDICTVTDGPSAGCAKCPYGELNPSRKHGRELRVELPRIDALGERGDDIGAPARREASSPVAMRGVEPAEDACPMKIGVHERVYCDEARSCRRPALTRGIAPKQ